MSYPITPDPAIHNVPSQDITPLPDSNLLQGFGEQLLEAIVMAILEKLGLNPAVSQQAVQTLVNIFNNLFALFGTLGSDLSVVSADIHSIIENFVDTILGPIGGLLDSSGIFGSTFPKLFPFTFGTSTSGTLGSFITGDEFQQLLDGIVNNGTIGNRVQDAIGAIRNDLAIARSDVSQAILDGVHQTNANTGIASALQNFPNANITAILGTTNLGTDIQAIIDNIANAMGQSGTGHTLTNLLAYLESIPNVNITAILGSANLGADVQAIVDQISNAMGQSGTGHTLGNLLTYLEGIPNANITAVLGSSNLGADVQAIVDKLANGLGQSGTGHTLANLLSYIEAIPNANITAVLGSANLGADIQAVVDKISNALGQSGTGHTLANLLTYLSAIPLGNLSGFLTGIFGSSFPKSLPFTFGQSTSGTVGNFVTFDQFQQLLDGLANNGTTGNHIQAAIGAIRNELATARSDVSQAILDGTNQTNANTGIASALANFPSLNVTSVLGQGNLGADVQALVTQGTTALGGVTTTLEGWLSSLQTIPNENIQSQFGFANVGSDVQSIVDFAVNALTGGSGTGNAPAALQTNLAAIQQATNIVIPPNPGTGSVTHDASGNGTNTGSSGTLTNSWSHTTGAGANLAVVQTATYCSDSFSDGGGLTRGVKWGSTAMSNLGGYVDEDFLYHEVFVLWNPPAGTVTVTASSVESGFSIEAVSAMAAASDTFIGAGAVGSVTKATGLGGTNPSVTQSAATGDIVVNSFAATSIASTMGTYNQTSLFTVGDLGAPSLGFTAGDAAGASSVTFTDTSPGWGSGGLWTGIAFNLSPMLATEIGSGFMSNRTSIGTVASTAAVAAISSAFYTQTAITGDLTWTPSTNTIQVTYAGWYMVSIGILLSGHTNLFGVALFHNGSVAQLGTVYPSNVVSTSGMPGPFTASFTIYLSAGDTIQPGYDSGAIGNTMTGEATGASSYFNVALLNRSVY